MPTLRHHSPFIYPIRQQAQDLEVLGDLDSAEMAVATMAPGPQRNTTMLLLQQDASRHVCYTCKFASKGAACSHSMVSQYPRVYAGARTLLVR
mmetsp:Transcript_19869/g.57086  ORF Transcript_19869/g.57086 Transcript_19869/m.57086 type:complete len:93 (-) Transcript_19869:485-763(-)